MLKIWFCVILIINLGAFLVSGYIKYFSTLSMYLRLILCIISP